MLRGFDDYVNMVLEDVTEFELSIEGGYKVTKIAWQCSTSTP
jgi:small nuclear ribonucleoprotein (snRNP)-like protein